jgi:peroxiredoxin
MLDVRRTILALLAVLGACTHSVAQEKNPKEADEVLSSPTPPAAQPVEEGQPLSPDKPAARAPVADESKDAPPTDESEGKRLLRRSAEAIRAARAITYSAKAYSTGALESLTPKADGLVKMRRVAGGAPDAWLARITGRTTKKGAKAGDGESLDFDVAYLGNKRIEWADPKAQKIVEKVDRSAQSPIVQGAKSLRIDELFAAAPYTRDLTAGTATIIDRKTIAGVECEVVQIEMGERKNKTRWYLGLDDHLPRRVDRVIEGAMASEVVVEASDLKVETSEEPSISASSLRIPVQPGWTEEREPVAPPPQPVQPTHVGADPTKGDVVPSKIDARSMPAIATPTAPAPPPPPRLAPEFELTTAKGEKVSLQALRDSGASAVVLDFFGPWSLLARDWHPRLDELAKRFADRGVRVLALSVRAKNNDDSVNMTKEFSFTTMLNADKVARDYAIAVYPTTVVINRSGEIVRTIPGSKDDLSDTVAEAIEEAVTGQKPAPKGESSTPAVVPPAPSAKPDDSAAKSEAEKADKAKDAEEGTQDQGSKAE